MNTDTYTEAEEEFNIETNLLALLILTDLKPIDKEAKPKSILKLFNDLNLPHCLKNIFDTLIAVLTEKNFLLESRGVYHLTAFGFMTLQNLESSKYPLSNVYRLQHNTLMIISILDYIHQRSDAYPYDGVDTSDIWKYLESFPIPNVLDEPIRRDSFINKVVGSKLIYSPSTRKYDLTGIAINSLKYIFSYDLNRDWLLTNIKTEEIK